MTATTYDVTVLPHKGARVVFADAWVMTKRNLIKYLRVPELLVFSTISPIMFVLLFAFVFGGAIPTPGIEYIDFLMPGIFIQTVVFGATQTGVGLAEDLSKGMIDRFRSLPMARSAVLAGRTISDAMRNVFVILLMTGVGYLIGFRLHEGIAAALGALGLGVLFAFAFSWIAALNGLAVGSVEAVQTSSFLWVLPLTFASSAFVPIQTMPDWLQAFARINPITVTVDALRGLVLGDAAVAAATRSPDFSTTDSILKSLAWIAVILVVFVPLSVRKYRRVA
jgi:ABC transporter DrrB family efflux protein